MTRTETHGTDAPSPPSRKERAGQGSWVVEKPTCSLLGILGLGSVHEEREDLGRRVDFAQHCQDGADVFADNVLGLSNLKSRRRSGHKLVPLLNVEERRLLTFRMR